MDTIFAHGLIVEAHIGVTDAEREQAQRLKIDVEVLCDAAAAAREDDIEKAVDYHAVVVAIRDEVTTSSHRLVETLAEHLAARIRRDFGAEWIAVRIAKPDVLEDVEEVGVAIERHWPGDPR